MSALRKQKGAPGSGTQSDLLGAVRIYANRLKVKRALAHLKIRLPFNGDYTIYCGEAGAILVLSIEMDAGIDYDNRTPDQALNSMFFMLVTVDVLSSMLDVHFEEAALFGADEFVYFDSEAPVYLKKARDIFRGVTRQKGIVKSIENVLSCWVASPEDHFYETLVDMYKTTAKFVKY